VAERNNFRSMLSIYYSSSFLLYSEVSK